MPARPLTLPDHGRRFDECGTTERGNEAFDSDLQWGRPVYRPEQTSGSLQDPAAGSTLGERTSSPAPQPRPLRCTGSVVPGALRDRRLDDTSVPFVYLDATYLHVRADHHVVSKVVVIATGVSSKGMREVGFDVGDSEDEVL